MEQKAIAKDIYYSTLIYFLSFISQKKGLPTKGATHHKSIINHYSTIVHKQPAAVAMPSASSVNGGNK
jgi:hypothetical protein